MPKIQIVSALASLDSLLAGGPSTPRALQLSASPALRVRAHAASGSAVLRPYYRVSAVGGGDAWVPLGGESASPSPGLAVAASSFAGQAEARFPANSEPRWWLLLRESGAGVVDDAELDGVETDGARVAPVDSGGGGDVATTVKQGDAGVVSAPWFVALSDGSVVLGSAANPLRVDAVAATDVSDRTGRLLGVVYGSQAQQLLQSAANYNLYTELRTDGTAYDARQIRALTSSDQVTVVPSGTQTISGSVSVDNFPASQTVTGPLTDAQLRNTAVSVSGTFYQATQPVSGTFWQATQPVSAAALPLPAGASTAALQSTGNTSLGTLVTNSPGLVSGRIPVDGSAVTQPVSIATSVAVTGTFWQATQPVSAASLPLPSGAATSALQTTGNASLATLATNSPTLVSGRVPVDPSGVTSPVSAASLPLPSNAAVESGGHLAAVDAKTPSLGIAVAAASVPTVIASDQPAVATKGAAAAFADGASVTQGSVGDAESPSGNGTEIAILKRLRTLLSGALTVAQSTASALKAQVSGAGSAGTPDAGVVTVQGISGGQAMPISGTVSTSGSTADITDRAARLLGVVYGSLAQQLKQTATNFNLAAEIFVGGSAVDPRAVRALTSADVVTAAQATAANLLATVTQGAAAALAAAWPTKLTDGTNGPTAVKAASVAAAAGDAALVVSLSPNSPITTLSSVSTANSSAVALLANVTFTGTFVSTLILPEVCIAVFHSEGIASPCTLTVDWSTDGTNIDDSDVYSIPANNGQQLSFGAKAAFVRVSLLNGSSNQTALRLQTILRPFSIRPSTVRTGDTFTDDQDAILGIVANFGRDAAGTWRAMTVDASGSQMAQPAAASTSGGGSQISLVAATAQDAFVASSTRLGGCIYSNNAVININIGATATAAAYTDQILPQQSWYVPPEVRGLRVSMFSAVAGTVQVTSWS